MKQFDKLVPNNNMRRKDILRVKMQLQNNSPKVVSNHPAS